MQWYELRFQLRYHPGDSCTVRVVFTHDWLQEIHFYFYDPATSRLLMHATHSSVGYLLDVRSVKDPLYPDQQLLLFYTAAQYPVGYLWRVNPQQRWFQKVLEATYLDATHLLTKRQVTEWIPAHYVFAEGKHHFELMAKRSWLWQKNTRRFVPTWWQVAKPCLSFFEWIDRLSDRFDQIGKPCPAPAPVPDGLEAKEQYMELWTKAIRLDNTNRRYRVQMACNGSTADDAFLCVYESTAVGSRLLRCTRLASFGHVLQLRAVPHPDNPQISLIVAYRDTGKGTVWRVDPETMRPVVLLDEFFIDTSRLGKGIVVQWAQALALVGDNIGLSYPPAFRKPGAMAFKVWQWDKRRHRFVCNSAWRIGGWSGKDWQRFGFCVQQRG